MWQDPAYVSCLLQYLPFQYTVGPNFLAFRTALKIWSFLGHWSQVDWSFCLEEYIINWGSDLLLIPVAVLNYTGFVATYVIIDGTTPTVTTV